MTTTAEAPPKTPPPAAPAAQTHDEHMPLLTHRQILTILSGLVCGMLLAALDQTIVSTSIRTIADDLHGLSEQAWVTTAYLITSTITTPIYGKLSDIYGRKKLYLTAITIFLIGSLACTISTSMAELASFRAVQGVGAGGLMSLAMTIVGDIVPPRERARYSGYMMATFGMSSVVGPVLGGLFAGMDSFVGIDGWRWVFLVNMPVGLVALVVVSKVLNVPHKPRKQRVDWWGAFTSIIALVPLLLVAEQGREWGWSSHGSLVCYGIAAGGILLFIAVELGMGDAALIPMRLFRNSAFTVAVIGGFIVGVAMFGSIMLIPQYMQIVKGYTPTQAGLLSLPIMVGIFSAAQVSGRITGRTGRYKMFPIIGTLLIATGALLFANITWDAPLWQPLLCMFIIGFGLGNSMQTLMIAVQNAGPRKDMGVSTASATFFRQIGGTTGVAVFLSVLFTRLPGHIKDAFVSEHTPPQVMAKMAKAGNVMQDSSFLQRIPLQEAKPFFIGFTNAIHDVFFIAGAVGVIAAVVLCFLKETPLVDVRKMAAEKEKAGEPDKAATPA